MEILRGRVNVSEASKGIEIIAFGDLQMGADGYRADLFKICKSQIEENKKAYVITMGDIRDNYRPSIMAEMKKVFAKDPMARRQFDASSREEMKKIADSYSKFADRILVMLEGHHKIDYADGTTSTQYLCQLLKAPYGGFVCMYQLDMAEGSGNHATPIDIYATHGSCKAAPMERKTVGYWDADVFLYGHSCEVDVKGLPPMMKATRRGNPEIVRKPRIKASTGGFMEGYVVGSKTYVEDVNMPPAPLGWVKMNISIHRKHSGGPRMIGLDGKAYVF